MFSKSYFQLIFVQACRGTEKSDFYRNRKVANHETGSTWPIDADILIHYSTAENKCSLRDQENGSIFIQALVSLKVQSYNQTLM